ncbi:MAG: glycosyltransferase [Pseudomonadota bacterium]|nr:glycosyltransferase [Pseudomonadota bacterium]
MNDSPLSIAHLLLTRRFAGSERHAVELANAQAEAGHDVSMILRRAGAQERADAIASRLSPRVKTIVVGDLFAIWQARRVLKKLRPDIAHAHLSGGARALKGLRGGHTRRIATLHICYKPQQHEGLDGLIAIAPWQLQEMPADMRARSVQIDNWTLPQTAAAGARTRLRAELGIAQDAWVFGALGRVEPSKGLDVLLAAWQRAALPADARLLIAGQGSAWQALRAQAADSVLMPGFVSRPRDWLEVFDVFVSAAGSEPFGLVLLEAMDSGLPIIASASQGARHLQSAIATPLLPIGDIDALAAALRKAYQNRPARREYPMQQFRIDDKLAQIEAFYRR